LPDTVRHGHEPLAVGSERANARGNAVRDHQHRIDAEHRRDLRLVGLQLIEGFIEGRVFVSGRSRSVCARIC
jgi:hypothetical protein